MRSAHHDVMKAARQTSRLKTDHFRRRTHNIIRHEDSTQRLASIIRNTSFSRTHVLTQLAVDAKQRNSRRWLDSEDTPVTAPYYVLAKFAGRKGSHTPENLSLAVVNVCGTSLPYPQQELLEM